MVKINAFKLYWQHAFLFAAVVNTAEPKSMYKMDDDDDVVGDPAGTTEQTIGGGEISFNLKVTVGIIGGFAGLALLVGVGIGIYLNYKKGIKLGFFRKRPPQEPKNISILGEAYPNIAISNTDMRMNERNGEEPALPSLYPNYASANPAATELVPPIPSRLI